jgi:hypothetical protein
MPYIVGSKSKYVYYQWTLDHQLVKEWPSVIIAEREGGFDSSMIIKCCTGKYKTHKGFIWTRELKTKTKFKN